MSGVGNPSLVLESPQDIKSANYINQKEGKEIGSRKGSFVMPAIKQP